MKAAKHESQINQTFCLSSSLSLSLLMLGKHYKWQSRLVSKQYDIATLFTLLPKAMLDGTHNSVLRGERYCLGL